MGRDSSQPSKCPGSLQSAPPCPDGQKRACQAGWLTCVMSSAFTKGIHACIGLVNPFSVCLCLARKLEPEANSSGRLAHTCRLLGFKHRMHVCTGVFKDPLQSAPLVQVFSICTVHACTYRRSQASLALAGCRAEAPCFFNCICSAMQQDRHWVRT